MKKVILATVAAAMALGMTGSALAGDAAAGKAKFGMLCASCHGADAKTPIAPTYPNLAGQSAGYAEAALNAYKADQRTSPNAAAMTPMAKMLSDADVKNIAAFLTSIK